MKEGEKNHQWRLKLVVESLMTVSKSRKTKEAEELF